MKKIFNCIIVVIFVCCCINLTACKGVNKNSFNDYVDFIVKVESGRDIRVLQLTDTQIIDSAQIREGREGVTEESYNAWTPDKTEARLFGYVREILSNYTPDLIIVTGDLVYGEFDDEGSSFIKIIEFFDSCKIPWAPVFGNHENESKKGVDWQCEQLENSKYCLFKQRQLTGNGNYSVGLVQDDKLARVFYMLDSNGCSSVSNESLSNRHTVKTAGFGSDQIEYYTQSINCLKSTFPDVKISMAFHIPFAISNTALEANGAYLNKEFNFDKDDNPSTFGYYDGVERDFWDGRKKIWAGIKELGIVDSIFFGHEHTDSASVIYDGVRFTYGLKTGVYDGINYIHRNGDMTFKYSYVQDTVPMCGGTAIIIKADGNLETYHIYNTSYIE